MNGRMKVIGVRLLAEALTPKPNVYLDENNEEEDCKW